MESKGEVDPLLFHGFLEEFCKTHHGEFSSKRPLPFRLVTMYVRRPEFEGEIISWLLAFLDSLKCPPLLAYSLTRVVVEDVLALDIATFLDSDDEEVDNKVTDEAETFASEKKAPPSDEEVKSAETNEVNNAAEEDACESDKTSEPPEDEKFLTRNVMVQVLSKLYALTARWRDSLPEFTLTPFHMDVSDHAVKNTRRKMEDKHIAFQDINLLYGIKDEPQNCFFGVFDGHGGIEAANYSVTHMMTNVVRHKAFLTDPMKAFREGILRTDEGFTAKAKDESLHSGSTGVCALVREKMMYVGWVGDSQALLIRDGVPVEIMQPHKPEREDEKDRIEALGGCVVWFGAWRVNGTLSVSRSIGDVNHKPLVCADPDMNAIEMHGNEDYLVLACDGMWDVIQPRDIPNLMEAHLRENDGDRSKAAHMLVKTAQDEGSNDNITVIVVFLDEYAAYVHSAQSDKISQDSKDALKDSDSENKDSGDQNDTDQDSNSNVESEKDRKNESNKGSSKGSKDSNDTPSSQLQSSSDTGDLSLLKAIIPSHRSDSNKPIVSSSQDDSVSTNQSMELLDRGSANVSPEISVARSFSASQSADTGNTPSRELSQTRSSTHSTHSNASSTDMVLMAKTASKCINNRKAKRSKNGRNGRTKDTKKGFRSRLGGLNLSMYGSSRVPPRSRSAESNLSLAQKSMLRSGDQIFEILTGCSTNVISKTKSNSKWTVAVEIESGSAMFEDLPSPSDSQKGRRQSDTSFFTKK